MRVVIHTDGRTVQGNERQLALLARGLVERGIDLHISAVPDTATWALLAATGAGMTATRPRGSLDLPAAWRFSRWLQALRPDAILLTSWRRMPLASRAARRAGVPRIVLRLGMTHGAEKSRYRRALAKRVDQIIVNSTAVREHVLRNFPAECAPRVRMVHNAVPPSDAPPAPLRRQLGLNAETPIVTAVGGLSHRKGFDILIAAFADVPGDAHLVVCGSGALHADLHDRAHNLGIEDCVHLIGQRDDVPAVLRASDVFVLSSRAEGFSVALLEAMHAGLPIVATDVGGSRDALGDDGGWIVPPDDAGALRMALADVIATLNTDKTKARAAVARQRALDLFSVAAMVDGVIDVLRG